MSTYLVEHNNGETTVADVHGIKIDGGALVFYNTDERVFEGFGDGHWTRFSKVEQTEAPAPTFAVGDRIKVTNMTAYMHGREGVIKKDADTDGHYYVAFDGTYNRYLTADQMEKVEAVVPLPTFRVGDRVVRTGAHKTVDGTDYGDRECQVGSTGTVRRIHRDGDVSVAWDDPDSSSSAIIPASLTKLPALGTVLTKDEVKAAPMGTRTQDNRGYKYLNTADLGTVCTHWIDGRERPESDRFKNDIDLTGGVSEWTVIE